MARATLMNITSRSGSGNGTGFEQHRVHHRKDRRIRADAERQRGHRRGGERAALGEHPQRVLEVPENVSKCCIGIR